MDSALNKGHRSRLRERLAKDPLALADYEILEMLLGYALPRKDTKPLAKTLLARFKNLRGVLDAGVEEMRGMEGAGPGLLAFFGLLREYKNRYAESPVRGKTAVASPQMLAAAARARLAGRASEEVWVAYLDTQNRIVSWEMHNKGTNEASFIHPRDIIERAILLKASAFVVVHNHPGGNSAPSGADLQVTEHIKLSARTMQLRFLDHLIVTESEVYSILSDGLLDEI